jgi:hypothetical protein
MIGETYVGQRIIVSVAVTVNVSESVFASVFVGIGVGVGVEIEMISFSGLSSESDFVDVMLLLNCMLACTRMECNVGLSRW